MEIDDSKKMVVVSARLSPWSAVLFESGTMFTRTHLRYQERSKHR
jgi:hypothetical protein